jgi:hypothetical protein
MAGGAMQQSDARGPAQRVWEAPTLSELIFRETAGTTDPGSDGPGQASCVYPCPTPPTLQQIIKFAIGVDRQSTGTSH